jgi:hypothetical protein
MIPIIGCIVAVYAICRLAQVAFEITREPDAKTWGGLPFVFRFVIIIGISTGGIVILLGLTVLLLVRSMEQPRLFPWG